MSLADTDAGERTLVRLDTMQPHDPLVVHLAPGVAPERALGPIDRPSDRGQRLSEWLVGIEAVPR